MDVPLAVGSFAITELFCGGS